MNKIIFRLLGGILILSGISIWINPVFYSSRFGITFDYSGINKFLSVIFVALGVYFIWSTFKKKDFNQK
jgi:hypothetical protein